LLTARAVPGTDRHRRQDNQLFICGDIAERSGALNQQEITMGQVLLEN
jgi:hypothetical protein